MSGNSNENLKLLSPFVKLLNIFLGLTFKREKSIKMKIFYYCHTLSVLLILIWFLASKTWIYLLAPQASLTFYSQTIDRMFSVICPILIVPIENFCGQRFDGIINDLNYIDNLMECRFRIKIDYRKLKVFTILSFIFFDVISVALNIRIFFRGSYEFYPFFILYITENFFLYFIQTFYLTILYSIYHRMTKLQGFIESISEVNIEMEKFNLEEVLFKVSGLVDLINECCGRITVVVYGESKFIMQMNGSNVVPKWYRYQYRVSVQGHR